MTGSQGQDTSEALAAAIRQAVRIHHIGPNSANVIENGGAVLLTPQEADEAATNMRDWFQRALAAERERAWDEGEESLWLRLESAWREESNPYRGNPHTEESP